MPVAVGKEVHGGHVAGNSKEVQAEGNFVLSRLEPSDVALARKGGSEYFHEDQQYDYGRRPGSCLES